jgi:hypothetical protein
MKELEKYANLALNNNPSPSHVRYIHHFSPILQSLVLPDQGSNTQSTTLEERITPPGDQTECINKCLDNLHIAFS